MFNIGDAAMEEIKAISGKIAVALGQQVGTTVEEIQAVPDRVAESLEWIIENCVKDATDTLIEVVMAMEDAAGAVWRGWRRLCCCQRLPLRPPQLQQQKTESEKR